MAAGSVNSPDESNMAAAAEREAQSSNDQVTIIFPGRRQPRAAGSRKTQNNTPSVISGTSDSELEPLIDTTAKLSLNSKKILRLRRRAEKKQAIRKAHSHGIQSFLDLPPELLLGVLGHLLPSDVSQLLVLNTSMRSFILGNESAITEEIIKRRYWVLRQCFPLPVTLDHVPVSAQQTLLSQGWQDRLRIHKNPYQHIKPIDPYDSVHLYELCASLEQPMHRPRSCALADQSGTSGTNSQHSSGDDSRMEHQVTSTQCQYRDQSHEQPTHICKNPPDTSRHNHTNDNSIREVAEEGRKSRHHGQGCTISWMPKLRVEQMHTWRGAVLQVISQSS